TFFEDLERFSHPAGDGELAAHAVEACRQVALPFGVARVRGCQFAPDRKAFLISREGTDAVAHRQPHITDPVEAQRDIALPQGVVRIAGDARAYDGETILVARQRLRPRTGGKLNGAKARKKYIKIALQVRVAKICRRELADDGKPLLGRGLRLRQVS